LAVEAGISEAPLPTRALDQAATRG
jgi:hypothetical protein